MWKKNPPTKECSFSVGTCKRKLANFQSHAYKHTHAANGQGVRILLNFIGRRRRLSCQFRAPRNATEIISTHRLCDKKRDSASFPIRLFFRPSSIADAAISIFYRVKRRRFVVLAMDSANPFDPT